MKLALSERKIQQTIKRNGVTSYGLTLAIGLPFPQDLTSRILWIQHQLESSKPGGFSWYNSDHLHATLAAPLRSRYREHPPLRRAELPSDLTAFAGDLVEFFSQLRPFRLEFSGVAITEDGAVTVQERNPAQQLVTRLRRYPELDGPKHVRGLRVVIGFVSAESPLSTETETSSFLEVYEQVVDTYVGSVLVTKAWLVHYASRTLDRIVGKIPLSLGRPNHLTAEDLIQGLNIQC